MLGSSINVVRLHMTGNVAGMGGGGVGAIATSRVTLRDSLVSHNTLKPSAGQVGNGGGVFLSSSSTLSAIGTAITHNDAASGGGGVYAALDSFVNITGGSLSDNSATSDGGGITASESSVHLRDTTISRNSAGVGAAVYSTSSEQRDLVLGTGTSFFGNVAWPGHTAVFITPTIDFVLSPAAQLNDAQVLTFEYCTSCCVLCVHVLLRGSCWRS